MNKIFLFLFTMAVTASFAQISISKNDLPQAGVDYFRSTASNTDLIDLTETGANHMWDYSTLTRQTRDTLVYEKVSNTPFVYQFLFNNPLSQTYLSTEAKWTPDVNIGGLLTLSDNYLYSQQSNSAWTEVGIGTSISGVPLPNKYSNVKTKLKLPLNYQDYNNDDYSYLIQIPTIGATGQEGSLSYEVDGWGTIKLPGGTYDVLRVKTEINKSDTLYLDALGFGLKIPSPETVYEWYAKGEGYPVLTVTTSLFGAVSVAQFSDNLINNVDNSLNSVQNKIYPNPTHNLLHLDLHSADLTVSILDVSGSEIITISDLSPSFIDVSTLPKGMYFVKLVNEKKHQVLRFIKY